MKANALEKLTAMIAAVAAFSTVHAATTFNGGDLGNAGNWTGGLPTSPGNPGSIAVNGTVSASGSTTYTNYHITQTAGVISYTGSGSDPRLDGGTFEQNGGTWGVANNGRGFRIDNGNVTTLTSGKIISGTLANTQIIGSTLNVNGGSLETYGAGRGILLSGGGTLNINGGSVFTETSSATNIFGIGSLATGSNTINLNGGVTNVNFLGFGRNNSSSQLTLTVGGSTVGSFTAVDFVALSANELITERDIRWLPGSLMTMTITNEADWAEIEWDAGRMLYNGQGFGALGDWATVNGSIFSWNGTTNTLSLAAVPEPSAAALFTTFFAIGLAARRRCCRA